MTRESRFLRAVSVAGALLVTAPTCGLLAEESKSRPATTFFVYYHSPKGPIVGRTGVQVFRVGSDGSTPLGVTDADGEITLDQAESAAPGAAALLFCEPQLPEVCAALRVDSAFLKGFAEFTVHLPPIETIDRMRVTPR